MPNRLRENRQLNARQLEIARLIATGLTNKDIAQLIGTTEHVTKNYLKLIYDRLGFDNRLELALWYEAQRIEGEKKQ